MTLFLNSFQIFLFWLTGLMLPQQVQPVAYPEVELSNGTVNLKIYLPDSEKGYYRGTRFDWTGVISSLEYKGHNYFGEWSKTRNPLSSNDIVGPVNGYIAPGLGYAEAAAGGEFIRIGVGVIEKAEEADYKPFISYKIIDNGKWSTKNGKDWVEFTHEVKRPSGWGFIYTKRIELTKDKQGFIMKYSLTNTGDKAIVTDQFNHNFFVIDKGKPGPDFTVKFPFECKLEANSPRNRPNPLIKLEGNTLNFTAEVTDRDVWQSLSGFGKAASDNKFEIVNTKTKAGAIVQGSKPLGSLIFWANKVAVCPETSIDINVAPGETDKWEFTYSLYTID